MNSKNARRILRSQSRRSSHGIAAMRRDNFLIGFEAPARCFAVSADPLRCVGLARCKRKSTHAPPELSEPAITRMRFMVVSKLGIVFWGLMVRFIRWLFESFW